MKLPRDVGGEELVAVLKKYGYQVNHQAGSHMRLTSTFKGTEHHITIPHHKPLRTGTFHVIINQVAAYLEVERQRLLEELFS